MFRMGVTGKDLAELSRELKKAGNGTVTKQLRKEISAAAAPYVSAVRSSILGIPVKGEKSTGLRGRLSKALTLRVRTSGKNAQVSILMSTGKMPDGQKSLPAMMEGTKKWRHPVFGDHDSENWVEQPSHPYFFPVMKTFGPAAKKAVNKVVNSITSSIT
jgi:hypothetical protein